MTSIATEILSFLPTASKIKEMIFDEVLKSRLKSLPLVAPPRPPPGVDFRDTPNPILAQQI
jgi:hypothetical protein